MVLPFIKNYIDILKEILNLEWHLHRCIGIKVTAILLKGWILPTGGVASGRMCPAACAGGLFITEKAISNCLGVGKKNMTNIQTRISQLVKV